MWNLLLLAIMLTFALEASSQRSEVEIQTRLGRIIGTRQHTNRGMSYQFLDIPYGKAPVDQLRFQKPQAFGAWSGKLNATVLGPVCTQTTIQPYKYPGFTEDCLKLNIHVPNNVNLSQNKSVMVWFHGGAFSFGSGGFYDASMLSLVGDVIVVTINYRLGIFGFLASRNSKVKGNAGLWDQILALNWVKYNIKDYGGNPEDVTIFGESAGGMSVSLQSLIPSNRGLFHRVIAQSGVANSMLALSSSVLSSIEVGKIVGCQYDHYSLNDLNFIDCLRGVNAEDLVRATDLVTSQLGFKSIISLPFGPIVDGDLIRRHPLELLMDQSSSEYNFFQSLDILSGTCTGEGSLVVSYLPIFHNSISFNFSQGVPRREMSDSLIPMFTKALFNNSNDISNMICEKYCVSAGIQEQGREFLNMWADAAFNAPTTLFLERHSNNIQGKATYQYVFSDELSYTRPVGAPWYTGSAHATDVFYLFLYEQLQSVTNFTDGADVLVQQMRSYWTNFAKTG